VTGGLSKGKVYLVGAGPGDPKLITLRGLECIRMCDVIVYDRLASPRLLMHVKPGAERIYVGKLPDRHTMKQEEINRILVEQALQGKIVTRLKGGDPTVFGRGGEEAEALRREGIEFEIVPGVTSAIAVPAYAGIPVTHRDLASSVSIITGHENPEKLDELIQWDRVTNATGTLVFLMGVARIGHIARQLIRHGRPPGTPIALIRWGTTANQRTLVGTLADIEDKVKAAGFEPPAVIVVGDVVRQRDKLMWYEKRPLFGARVLVTRAQAQAGTLSQRIEELGGEPIEYPAIETRMPEGAAAEAAIGEALAAAETYDHLIFTSVNGVRFFLEWLRRFGQDIRRFHRARIAAVGPKTAEALREIGLAPAALPETFHAEGLLDSMRGTVRPGQRALLPRGDLARKSLPEALRGLGVTPVEIDVYETVPAGGGEDILDLLREGGIHIVTFTSASTVRNLIGRLRNAGVGDPAALLGRTAVASIGPLTSAAAREAGLTVAIEPPESTIDALTAAIAAYWAERRPV